MYSSIRHLHLLKFKGCDECTECCKSKYMAPLVLEDFEKVYKYFPILIAKLDKLKPVMLLSNSASCPYLENKKCSIYENRPPACKIYPYSPWFGDILLDLSCKGVGIEGKTLPLTPEEFLKSDFYEERFENITEKIKNTNIWLAKQEVVYFRTYKNIKLYILKNARDDYAHMHKNSLMFLSYYFN
ncbi:YkgJ family cysteine cluster protein [Nautilia sp.]